MVKNGAFSTLTLSLTIARVVVPSQVDVRARSRVNGFTTAVFFSFFFPVACNSIASALRTAPFSVVCVSQTKNSI